MRWIRKIYSTLQTWVFKNKVLKFSSRYPWEATACFYCPEMCRFSCSVAETSKNSALTPRGKMTLVHLMDRGLALEEIAGSRQAGLDLLEQCTSCGRCTEFCLHGVEVDRILREARTQWSAEVPSKSQDPRSTSEILHARKNAGSSKDAVFLSDDRRSSFWDLHERELWASWSTYFDLGFQGSGPDWSRWEDSAVWRDLTFDPTAVDRERITRNVDALASFKTIIVESPETLQVLLECGVSPQRLKTLWEILFPLWIAVDWKPETSLHESSIMSRYLSRKGVGVPLLERARAPLRRGVNALDCGGEGGYRHRHRGMAQRIAQDLEVQLCLENPHLKTLVCQSISCSEHMSDSTKGIAAVYWIDFLMERVGPWVSKRGKAK